MLQTAFSLFQIAWISLWVRKHLLIRKGRAYAQGREPTAKNPLYRALSYGLLLQNILCIWFFWSNEPYLWKFHDSDAIRFCGAALKTAATALYFLAIEHLGPHYSPCYDAHAPHQLVRSGPYAYLRHPMYVAKIAIGISEVLLSGSFWFVPGSIYLTYETLKSWHAENRLLYRENHS